MTRSGFALVVSLLVAIALSLVGLGALAVGVRETAIADSVERLEYARLRARDGALAQVEAWSTSVHRDLAIGESRDIPAEDLDVTVHRIDSTLFMVRAQWTGGPPESPGPVTARAALLVRVYPVMRIPALFPAALTVRAAGTLAGGEVVVPDSCPALPAISGPVTVAEGVVVTGGVVPPADHDPGGDPLRADLLEAVTAIRIAPGSVRPRALALDGQCRSGPLNWGAPAAGHPCHDLLPVIHATGPLAIEGGEGRGILVVDGDLVVDGPFRFSGIVLVRGRLTIRGGAGFEGAVRADSVLLEDGRIVRKPCAPEPVLAAPALDRAFRPAGRWWVPVF